MFDGLKEGKVGYVGVILIKLPLQENTVGPLSLLLELIDQRGLSDAGIAADGDKNLGTGRHLLKVTLQLGDFFFPPIQPVSKFKAPAEILFAKDKFLFPLAPRQIIEKPLAA